MAAISHNMFKMGTAAHLVNQRRKGALKPIDYSKLSLGEKSKIVSQLVKSGKVADRKAGFELIKSKS